MTTRPDWDQYFIDMCDLVASRSTCSRKHVGAVLTSQDHRVLSTGYNGSIPGLEHCNENNHLLENNHCIRTIHAEVNSITQAARNGISTKDSVLYCNTQPCWNCLKVILSAGIIEVVYRDEYKSDQIRNVQEVTEALNGKFRLIQFFPK